MVDESEGSGYNAKEDENGHDVLVAHHANTSITGAREVRSLPSRVFSASDRDSAVQTRSFRLLGSFSVVFITVLLSS
jgi:hypothetical protein